MSKKVAVVLTGCGFKDGAEITESVSTLIALSQQGIDYTVFAPDLTVVSTNHMTDETAESRSVIAEASRITRSAVLSLVELESADFDALVMPGGFGAALHLCDFASNGAQCTVQPDIKRLITQFHGQGKPIVALCIAPVLLAAVLGESRPKITIGNDEATAAEIEKCGAQHSNCDVDDIVIDDSNKLITSPAYMYGEASPAQVFAGIFKSITALKAIL